MTGAAPLIAVTRAADQSPYLVGLLVGTGYDVLEVPVIAIEDPADGGRELRLALAELTSFAWLVVTSPNGAERVRNAVSACEPIHRPRLAAVGPGTAAALGAPVDLIAASSVGEGLVEDFPVGSGRVLLVQAEAARPVVREGLTAKGWAVTAVVGYRTVAAVPPETQVAKLATADAVIFTSGSTVRHLVAAVGTGALPPVVISIGPATTAVATELGVRVTTTAPVHTLDGVVDALVGVLPPGHGGGRSTRS